MIQTKYYHNLVKSFPAMKGKTVLITGCTSGTGLVLAKTCADLGAKVVMLNRPSARADAALENLKEHSSDTMLIACDLQNFESVRMAGKKLREIFQQDGCDVLCNNAGVMGLPDKATGDGYDVQIQTNHLAHFLLTSEVWPLLQRAAELRGEARVVNHSSGARKAGGRPIITKYFEQNGGHLGGDRFPGLQKWIRYQQSKLANLLFSYALHERLPEDVQGKIKILCAHPGPTDTGLQGKTLQSTSSGLIDRLIIARTRRRAHSVEDGTSGIARCVCEANLPSSAFYGPATQGMAGPAERLEAERDSKSEALLWELSMKATKLTEFFRAI